MSARVLLALLVTLPVYEACQMERNYPLGPPAPPAGPQPPIPIPVPGGIPSLKPIQKPAGAQVLDSNLCNQSSAVDAGFQAALNDAAGGTLWIPAGCIVNLSQANGISSNTTLACGMGAGIHNMSRIQCTGEANVIYGNNDTNVTIEGCTMTGTYDPSQAVADKAWEAANGCPDWTYNGGDVAAFNGGSNITFTDNAVTNTIADEGVFFGGINGATISKNVFASNFENGLQLSSCKNCNVTGNYVQDAGIDIEDAGPHPPGTNSGTWSRNTFACVNGIGNLVGGYTEVHRCNNNEACAVSAGIGCSNQAGQHCTPGEYSGITFQNNLFTGSIMALYMSLDSGITLSDNIFTNGAETCSTGYY